MDYAEILQARLRTPEERLLAARLAGSVVNKPAETWQPEYQAEPGLETSNPEDWIPGPGTAKALLAKVALAGKALAAKGAGGLAMAGGAGIIRKGGNPDLVAIHQTSPRKLWPWVVNDKLPRELTAPSIAVNNGRITQDFGDTSGLVTFVARPDALDPKNVGGKIWPRDTYTPRAGQFSGKPIEEAVTAAREGELWGEGTRRELLRAEAAARNADRFGKSADSMVLGEGAQPDSPAHELAIRLAPGFSSYKAFEESPKGAALLAGGMHPTDLRNIQAAWQGDTFAKLQDAFPDGMPATVGDLGAGHFLEQMHHAAESGYMTRKQQQAYYEFLRNYQNIPAEYAEQKVLAPVGLHGGNFAGAIIREMPELQKAAAEASSNIWGKDLRATARYTQPEALNKLIESLASRGIPAVTTRHPEEEYYLARWLSEQSK